MSSNLKTQCNHREITPLVPHATEDLPPEFKLIIERKRACKNISFLTVKETALKCSKGVSTIWVECKTGDFVKPVNSSARSVRWVSSEVDAMLEARILMARTGVSIDLKLFVKLLSAPNFDVQNQV